MLFCEVYGVPHISSDDASVQRIIAAPGGTTTRERPQECQKRGQKTEDPMKPGLKVRDRV
jgi:hypothetical protein